MCAHISDERGGFNWRQIYNQLSTEFLYCSPSILVLFCYVSVHRKSEPTINITFCLRGYQKYYFKGVVFGKNLPARVDPILNFERGIYVLS
jgi:hypothetical protein